MRPTAFSIGCSFLMLAVGSACAIKAPSAPSYRLQGPKLAPRIATDAASEDSKVTPVAETLAPRDTPSTTPAPEPTPAVQLSPPSASWIRVPPSSRPDGTLAMFLHARGEGRLTVRKVGTRNSVEATLKWLRSKTRGLEVQERGESSRGLKREEFTFLAWDGRRAIAGRAGVYQIDGEAYAVVALCDKHVFDRYRKDFDRVLAEFRKTE